MKAWAAVSGTAGTELEVRSLPDLDPAPTELLIDVKAAALNRADLTRLDRWRPDAGPMTPGVEVAGLVVVVGAAAPGWSVGDRVMAMCEGGYAEQVCVDHRVALPVPEQLRWTDAAAIPVAFMTEHDALVTNAGFVTGESVLITAASSGVGLAGLQLAQLLGAQPLVVTVGSAHSAERIQALNVDAVIQSSGPDFAERVLGATDGRGADVILDHVGGSVVAANLHALALRGRLVTIGRLAGEVGKVDLDLLAYKQARIIGVTFRTRTVDERAAVARAMTEELMPALADGRLRPLVDRVYPFDEAVPALEHMAANRHFGKVVLEVAA